MHQRRSTAPHGHRAGAGKERGLTSATFVGSFPAADFRLQPSLPEIAFLGRSNVGKSSLINALVQRRALAHTSKSPGKTRALNAYNVEDRFYLVDLPGYGYARASKVERRGFLNLIRAYLDRREPLAGVVWLLDIRRDPSAQDLDVAARLAERAAPVLAAITKADKLSRVRRTERARDIVYALSLPEDQCVATSAKTREGIDELWEAIEGLVRRTGGPADRRSAGES